MPHGHNNVFKPNVTIEEVKSWLEWAGEKIISLPGASPGPAQLRCHWPDVVRSANDAYGYTKIQTKIPRPTKDEIFYIDAIATLPILIQDVDERVIVQKRSLILPLSHRHVYSWSSIAEFYHTNQYFVKRMFLHGLNDITYRVAQSNVHTFRTFFSAAKRLT